MSPIGLDNVQFYIQRSADAKHQLLDPWTIVGLWRARDDSTLELAPSPIHYCWYRFVSAFASPKDPPGSTDRLCLTVELPQLHRKPVTRFLDGPASFLEWLGLVSFAIERELYQPGQHGPLALRFEGMGKDMQPPTEDDLVSEGDTVPPPPDPPGQEPIEIVDTSQGLLASLYEKETIRTAEDEEGVKRLFQLSDLLPATIKAKRIPGLNPEYPLEPQQLLAIYVLINKVAHSDAARGQYLCDLMGLGKTWITLVMLAMLRHVRLMRQHITENPEDHNPPDSPGDSCQCSARFGLECLCVKGSLLRRWEETLPEEGFNLVLCAPLLLESWAREFTKLINTTINETNHPYKRSRFLHAYILGARDRFTAVPGADRPHDGKVAACNFRPECLSFQEPTKDTTEETHFQEVSEDTLKKTVFFSHMETAKFMDLRKNGNTLDVDLISSSTTPIGWETRVRTEGENIPTKWVISYKQPRQDQWASRANRHDISEEKLGIKADSSIVLIMARSILSGKKFNEGFTISAPTPLKFLPLNPGDARHRSPKEAKVQAIRAMCAAFIVKDEAHEHRSDETIAYELFQQTSRCNSGRRGANGHCSPYVLLLSGTPFGASMDGIVADLEILAWKGEYITPVKHRLADLESRMKEAKGALADENNSLLLSGTLLQKLNATTPLLDPWMLARNYQSFLLPGKGLQLINELTDPKVIVIEEDTPSQFSTQLKTLQSTIGKALQADLVVARGNEFEILTRKGLIGDAFAIMIRASAVPPILKFFARRQDSPGSEDPFIEGENMPAFPLYWQDIRTDLPPDKLKGPRPNKEGTSYGDKPDLDDDNEPASGRAEKIIRLARGPELLADPWFQHLLKICRYARKGHVYNPDGGDIQSMRINHPRHVIIFCPRPVITFIVYYFLRRQLRNEAICKLITSEFPTDTSKRNDLIMSWAQQAKDLNSDATPSGQANLIVGVVSVDATSTGINSMVFASIAVMFGEPMGLNTREQAIFRLNRRGQKDDVAVYRFRRRDNAALCALESNNNNRRGLCLGHFRD